MKLFVTASVAILALVLPILGSPTPSPLRKFPGPVKPDSYIVVLKDNVNKTDHLSALGKIVARDVQTYQQVTHDYSDVLNGYAAILRGAALDHVLNSKDVDFVEQDGVASIQSDVQERDFSTEILVEREDVQVERVRTVGGLGVDIYGIDTGIYINNIQFGGRASWGATFGGYASQDGNGHGTHTMGTAIGSTYGVATSANAIAVKVLSDAGTGFNSDVVAGVNYAASSAKSSKRPSVASMSLGGGASTVLDTAVRNAIAGGLHFSIAAGNSNVDASGTSPARVSTANTIGAIDSSNVKASFSNYGSILDVWAPGVNIKSAYIGSPNATAILSGTSMATPYVAGIIATALGEYGIVSPASMSASLKSHAQNVVTGAPAGTTKLKATLW